MGLSERGRTVTVTITKRYVPGRYGQLHLREAGADGKHLPVLLLHQNPSSSLEYEPLMQALATDRRVVAFDTPGYGMSDSPPGPLSIAEYVAAMAESLEAAGLGKDNPFNVYGFHTGSLLTVEMALARPDAVRQIALTGLPMRSAEERAAMLAKANDVPVLDEAGTVALDMGRKLWDYVVASRTKGIPLAHQARLWMDKYRALDKSSWAYVGVWSYDYERLRQVTQPALLIQPAEVIRDVSIAAARMIPDHTIADLPQFERDVLDLPEAVTAFAAAMRDFFGAPFLTETTK
jgi:pimeloyl-ACP methyl ester carboxylesterase